MLYELIQYITFERTLIVKEHCTFNRRIWLLRIKLSCLLPDCCERLRTITVTVDLSDHSSHPPSDRTRNMHMLEALKVRGSFKARCGFIFSTATDSQVHYLAFLQVALFFAIVNKSIFSCR